MLLQAFLKTSFISNPTSLGGCQLSFYVFFWYSSLHGEKKVGGYWERCAGTSWEQLGHGWRPFSLHAVHLRALNESVKQFLNTDILLPWHIEQGMKAKPPHVWHVWGCCTLCGTTHTHTLERKAAVEVEYFYGGTGAGFFCESLSHSNAAHDSWMMNGCVCGMGGMFLYIGGDQMTPQG